MSYETDNIKSRIMEAARSSVEFGQTRALLEIAMQLSEIKNLLEKFILENER